MSRSAQKGAGRLSWRGNALALLRDSPAERTRNKIAGWLDRFSPECTLGVGISPGEIPSSLSRLFGPACEGYMNSEGLGSVERHIERRQSYLEGCRPPFGTFHNGT